MRSFSYIAPALIAALPALAQTTGTPSTCTTAPTALSAFNIERTLTLPTPGMGTPGTGTGNPGTPGPQPATGPSMIFSTTTPNLSSLSQQTQAALLAGTSQLRENVRFDPATNTLTIQDFIASATDPSPFNPSSIQFSNTLSNTRIAIDATYFSCQPIPAGVIIGHVLTNSPNTPFGNVNGALVVVTFGYTTDNPPKLNNVTVQIPGVAGIYSGAAVGTLTFPTSSVNPPGTANSAPTIVFAQNPLPPTAQRQIILDVTGSKDPSGLPLTYSWRQVNTNVQAGINNGNTATPLITFNAKGDYTFEVTATNSKGVSSTAQITVTYYGQ